MCQHDLRWWWLHAFPEYFQDYDYCEEYERTMMSMKVPHTDVYPVKNIAVDSDEIDPLRFPVYVRWNPPHYGVICVLVVICVQNVSFIY